MHDADGEARHVPVFRRLGKICVELAQLVTMAISLRAERQRKQRDDAGGGDRTLQHDGSGEASGTNVVRT